MEGGEGVKPTDIGVKTVDAGSKAGKWGKAARVASAAVRLAIASPLDDAALLYGSLHKAAEGQSQSVVQEINIEKQKEPQQAQTKAKAAGSPPPNPATEQFRTSTPPEVLFDKNGRIIKVLKGVVPKEGSYLVKDASTGRDVFIAREIPKR